MLTGISSHHSLPTTRPSPQAPSLASSSCSLNQNVPQRYQTTTPYNVHHKSCIPVSVKPQQTFIFYLYLVEKIKNPIYFYAFGGALLGEGMIKKTSESDCILTPTGKGKKL